MGFGWIVWNSIKNFFKTLPQVYPFWVILAAAMGLTGFFAFQHLYLLPVFIGVAILCAIFSAGSYAIIDSSINGKGFADSFLDGFRKPFDEMFSIVGFYILIAVAMIPVMLIMAFFPPLFLLFLFVVPFLIFLLPLVVTRGTGALGCISASSNLVRGNYWPIMGHMIVMFFICFAMGMCMGLIMVGIGLIITSSPEFAGQLSAISMQAKAAAADGGMAKMQTRNEVVMMLMQSPKGLLFFAVYMLLAPLPYLFSKAYVITLMNAYEGNVTTISDNPKEKKSFEELLKEHEAADGEPVVYSQRATGVMTAPNPASNQRPGMRGLDSLPPKESTMPPAASSENQTPGV